MDFGSSGTDLATNASRLQYNLNIIYPIGANTSQHVFEPPQPLVNSNATELSSSYNTNVNILLTVIYLCILLIGLIGNFCYCYVVAVGDTRHRMKSATNYYLFSLSISDILLLLFGLPHDVANLWSPKMYLFGEFGCIARGWISETSTNASVLVIVAFTVERYFAICHPMQSSIINADSLSRSVKIIVAIWLIASSFALLVVKQYGVVVLFDKESQEISSIECTVVQLNKRTFELSSFIFFVLPMTIITILYGKIVYQLRKRNSRFARGSGKRNRTSASCSTPKSPFGASTMHRLVGGSQKGARDTLAQDLSPNSAATPIKPGARIQVPAASRSVNFAFGNHSVNETNNNNISKNINNEQDLSQDCHEDRAHHLSSGTDQLTSFNNNNEHSATRKQQPLTISLSASCTYAQPPSSNRTPTASNARRQSVALNPSGSIGNVKSVVKMLVFIVVLFFLCWAPFHAQRLMAVYVVEATSQLESIHNFLNHISGVSYYVSAVVNPILYRMQLSEQVSLETWAVALVSSASIGITSLVPWLFNMTFFERKTCSGGQPDGRMKMLLSFAVGSILGDIFFHLIPECIHVHLSELDNISHEAALRKVGLSLIYGIFLFIIVEKVIESSSTSIFFTISNDTKMNEEHQCLSEKNQLVCEKQSTISDTLHEDLSWTKRSLRNSKSYRNNNIDDNNNNTSNNNDNNSNNCHTLQYDNFEKKRINSKMTNHEHEDRDEASLLSADKMNKKIVNESKTTDSKKAHIDTSGYLNLIANCFDNFTHGLAIGASFLAGQKVGLLTTFVVLIHEIPHEICDYAILVKSGFTRWDAVRAQSTTAIFGVLGTSTALWVKSVQTLNSQTLWMLPFSAGGFLYIALVNIMTEIIAQNEEDSEVKIKSVDLIKQIVCVITGVAFMALVAFF